MRSPSPDSAKSVGRRSSRPTGFTLIELLITLAALAIVMVGVAVFTRTSAAAAASTTQRAGLAVMEHNADARIGEIARIAPQYGDLVTASASALVFRKRMAINAVACSYVSPTVQIDLPATDLAGLTVGDSVAVYTSQGTLSTADDQWNFGLITSVTNTAQCGRPTTIAVTLGAPPATGAISSQATVRIWATRSYAVQTLAGDTGSVLTETVNGAQAERVFGPFANTSVFSYYDGTGAPAASPAVVRLVRATFQPYGQQARAQVQLAPVVMEWPIAASQNVRAGNVPNALGTVTAIPRCSTPGATNYGDLRNPCVFPVCPWNPLIYANNPLCVPPPPCPAPTSQYTTGGCGAGYTGSITYESDKGAPPGCAWGGWYQISSSCTAVVPCTGSQYQTLGCGVGYTGSITQEHDATGNQPSCGWTAWYTISNTCVANTCTDPNANNYGQVGACTYTPCPGGASYGYQNSATCPTGVAFYTATATFASSGGAYAQVSCSAGAGWTISCSMLAYPDMNVSSGNSTANASLSNAYAVSGNTYVTYYDSFDNPYFTNTSPMYGGGGSISVQWDNNFGVNNTTATGSFSFTVPIQAVGNTGSVSGSVDATTTPYATGSTGIVMYWRVVH